MTQTPKLLSIEQISKAYRKRKVVDRMSLSIRSGEVIGLLGPNGAGKTTCFYMILGLIACDTGVIQLDDQNITRLAVHQRARLGIGYLPQEPSVFRKLSVRDNILAILETQKHLTRTQKLKRLEQLLEEFQIGAIRDSKGLSLSGGERRRVEIARALASEPKFILLDEPFAGIDPISIIEIKKIIMELTQRNIGVLITDHNVRDTLDICARAYILNDGKLLASGEPKAILENKQVKSVYLGEHFEL